MKKFIIGVGILIIAAVACLPYINGMIMEKAFNHCITEANSMYKDTDMGISLEVLNYDRGFRSSEIEWKINLGKLHDALNIDAVIIIDRATHGLTSVTSTSSLEKNDWYTSAIDNYVEGSNPLTLNTEYKLLGDIISTIKVDHFTVRNQNAVVEILPGVMSVQTDRKFKRFISNGTWDGLKVDDIVTLNSITTNSDLELISTYIWKGTSDVTMAGFSAEENGKSVEISNLKAEYSMDYNAESDRLATDVDYQIAAVNSPSGTISDIALAMGVAGLDGSAYEEAMNIYMDMVGSLLETLSEAGNDPKAVEEAIQAQMVGLSLQMMAVYEKLLDQGLEISIKKLNATLPEGTITGALTLSLLQDITMAQMVPIANQPELLFDYLTLNSNLSFPKVLAGDNPMLVSPLYPGMETGFFVENGKYLTHKSETRDQKLFLNDAEVKFN